MNKKNSVYYQLLDIAFKLSEASKVLPTSQDNVMGHTYERSEGPDETVLLNAVAIVDVSIFTHLPAGAVKLLVTRIIPELKRNNVFWHCDSSSNSKLRAALAALKRADILYSTETTNYYIVNPFKLRRGKPMSTIMASLSALGQENGIQIPNGDLRAPKRALLN